MTLETVIGAALVAVVLRDIFHTLFHPSGLGTIARAVFAGVWRATRPAWRRGVGAELAGPASLVAVVATWTGGIVVGFALVYRPALESFTLSHGRPPEADLGTALYVSTVAVSTLGLGDVVPTTGPMRAVVVVQALVGFLLLTAAISWVLQLYPALTRRRTLARSLHVLHTTRYDAQLGELPDPSDVVLLDGLREKIATALLDFEQYGESYFFREAGRETALAATLPVAVVLADRARAAEADPACRAAGERLARELDALRAQLDTFVGRGAGPDDAILRYARDHEHEPVTAV